jgi:hypothetical protein
VCKLGPRGGDKDSVRSYSEGIMCTTRVCKCREKCLDLRRKVNKHLRILHSEEFNDIGVSNIGRTEKSRKLHLGIWLWCVEARILLGTHFGILSLCI